MISIAKKIQKAGGTLYLVGGAVRDEIINRPITDEDYCITGLTQEQFTNLFPGAIKQGKNFPVWRLEGKEFALARTEQKTGKGHTHFHTQTSPEITIEQDLARRDLSINSMAKEVLTGKIIDPYNGKQDSKQKILRATSTHFSEDPLRVYRVARLAAVLEFTIERQTEAQMKKLIPELSTLSVERITEELKKALDTDKPSIFFRVLEKIGALSIHFPELQSLIGAEQPIKYHPEGDAFKHTMMTLDEAAKLTQNHPNRIAIRFSSLVHDVGKGLTPKFEYPHHYGHDQKGVAVVEQMGKRLKLPNKWISCGKTACREHMRGGIFPEMKPATKVDFIERVNKTQLGLEGLKIVVWADQANGRTQEKEHDFACLGKQMLTQVTGKKIKQNHELLTGLMIKEKLREERIKWIKINYPPKT